MDLVRGTPFVAYVRDAAVGDAPTEKAESIALARRRLLKLGAYVAPAVVGTLLLSGNAKAASCFPQTLCNPCAPCNPACFPRCRPN